MGKNGVKKKDKCKKKRAKLIVCSKKGCGRRMMPVCEALQEEIDRQGLDSKIEIKTKECLGACKKQPAVQLNKGGRLYTRITPDEAPELIEAAKAHLKL